MSASAARLLVIAGLLVLWEVAARLFSDPLFICPPSALLAALPPLLAPLLATLLAPLLENDAAQARVTLPLTQEFQP